MIPNFPSEADQLTALQRDSLARIDTLEAPIFNKTALLRVEKRLRTHPVVYYFSTGPDGRVLNLTGNPDKFQSTALADGIQIQTKDQAIQYIRLMFLICRSRKATLVQSPEDMPWLPKLSDAEAIRRDDLLRKYGRVLEPIQASAVDGKFSLRYHFVEDRQLKHAVVTLECGGEFVVEEQVLEREIPVVWVQ